MFGRHEMAERIAQRLCGPLPQAQAIVGALGSGKSSLRNLVANCITRQNAYPQIRMADVELWPFATSTAAVDAIIHRLIDELAGRSSGDWVLIQSNRVLIQWRLGVDPVGIGC